MKIDQLTKILLGLIAVFLFVSLINSFFASKAAFAVPSSTHVGRYQIAAWAIQPQNAEPRSGYYVLDTMTGAVVATKMEVHALSR